ncbi:transmembrane 7 superfamily member 3 isoform X2 [Cebidichthys violaceus]|uniref:transmembrane 7 superfamily member 3 isoform X2 n=1 Tax=Cebidichthys violaceus TaxID=271503 RepID=UPI0035CAF114
MVPAVRAAEGEGLSRETPQSNQACRFCRDFCSPNTGGCEVTNDFTERRIEAHLSKQRKMSRWTRCPLLLLCLLLACEVQAQVENRVIFLPGTFQNVNVSRNETVQAVVSRIALDVAYVTLQFHTQHRNATLSYTRVPGPGTSLTAVDSGLLSALQPSQASLSLFLSSPDEDTVAGTGVILPYSNSDPVPGACNTEFDLDIDPNVYILYNLYETTICFAPANLGYERGETPPACDQSTETNTRWRLRYDVYQYFLPENDLSERSLFSGIQAVADIQGMTENGKRVMTLSSSDMSTAVFNSIPGQGVIYSVVVRDPLMNTSASYVPVHTYACSFASTLDGCQTLGKISTKIFFTIAGFAGLFVCFFGHRFFKCGKHRHVRRRRCLRRDSGHQRLRLHQPVLHHAEHPQALPQQQLQCRVHRRALPSHRLRHDHGVGGARRRRRRPAAVPRAHPPVLPAQPVPHVAAGTRAPQDQRPRPEPPLPPAAQPPPGQSAAAHQEDGAGRRAHASAPVSRLWG